MSNSYIVELNDGTKLPVKAKNKKDAKIKVERDFEYWLIGVKEIRDMHSLPSPFLGVKFG